MSKKSIIFCLFMCLVFVNYIISVIAIEYFIEAINFIALEIFNEKRFYVYDTRNPGFGMYMWFALQLSFWIVFIFSVFCYWFYRRHRDNNIRFFIIIFIAFLVYFLMFSFICNSYRLSFFVLHFTSFVLMYVEIVSLYYLIDKYAKNTKIS